MKPRKATEKKYTDSLSLILLLDVPKLIQTNARRLPIATYIATMGENWLRECNTAPLDELTSDTKSKNITSVVDTVAMNECASFVKRLIKVRFDSDRIVNQWLSF
jgi:hypothetical protein